ncbi:MAG: GDYXXLXY domain-containing protein [Candidatus Obscuribacter sp.]|nr:GDYXXLXY domain-containing protein [Candidatus Obscuribacter sp.]
MITYDMFLEGTISRCYDITIAPIKFEHDQLVYVRFAPGRLNIWVVRVVAASTKELDLRPGEVLFTGRVDYAYERDVHVRYGIEQVFIKERTGSEIENKGNILVVARVDNEGKAVISHVECGNKVIYDAREMILGGK